MLPAFVLALSQPQITEELWAKLHLPSWTGAMNDTTALSALGCGIIAILVLRTFVLLATTRYQSRVVANLVYDVSCRLFSDYLRASCVYFFTRNSAQFIDAIVYDTRHAVRGIVPSVMALLLNVFLFLALMPVVVGH